VVERVLVSSGVVASARVMSLGFHSRSAQGHRSLFISVYWRRLAVAGAEPELDPKCFMTIFVERHLKIAMTPWLPITIALRAGAVIASVG